MLTTGTGSGKSLAYMIPIVDHVLRAGSGRGVQALVVYPMNALANSQIGELAKFLGEPDSSPVSYARYTGQESEQQREQIRRNPPDVLLTNYVMLELILTRYIDRDLVGQLGQLRFLVLDELHSYRGRQGADVALLVRRLREASGSSLLACVGTSATLATGGSLEDRQQRLADVSCELFGAPVGPDDVIGETLQRVTPDLDWADGDCEAALAAAVGRAEPPDRFVEFTADPLSSWLESTFGVRREDGRLVRAVPLPVDGPDGAAAVLSDLTGVAVDGCAAAIRAYLLGGQQVTDPETGNPAFAFRLHQFISRGDTVYASPEPVADRALSLAGDRFVRGSGHSRVLLPLAFCRRCGQDYYVVRRDRTTNALSRRDLGDDEESESAVPGFVYLNDCGPDRWPDDPEKADELLPADWRDYRGRWTRLGRRSRPRRLVVFPDGTADAAAGAGSDGGMVGWWMPTKFRFCLACRVSYPGILGSDFTRLVTLGSGGRATATTIMSLAAIRHLQDNSELGSNARKLLSFTDNRQDASLQAGHFNDFVEVTMLRAALGKALADSPAGLRHDEVAQRVFEVLGMDRADYAQDPHVLGSARERTDRTVREVLSYRLYRDLQRGWRVAQPNLEQCGLLIVGHESLSDLARDDDAWAGRHETLAAASAELREHVLRVVLDWMRHELAVRVRVLDLYEQERLSERTAQRLRGSWSLENERLIPASEVLTRSRDRRDRNPRWRYVSPRSLLGRFLRRELSAVFPGRRITEEETRTIIGQVFDRLALYGLVTRVGGRDGQDQRWQIPADALVWEAGDGTRPYRDHLRMSGIPDDVQPNSYFVDLYHNAGATLGGIEAREHTAQVSAEKREEREERFRSGDLPVLFCSPTMELGVDISELNVVNMRNVPPTPANYAQRSGRAGRGGQPALVFTYCSSGSSHDQYFFHEQERMISGQVEAPRIDLTNEDLIRAHVHAVWLTVSGLDLGQSMTDILDIGEATDRPKLLESIQAHLDNTSYRRKTLVRAEAVLFDLDLPDRWLSDTLAQIPARFHQALERWQTLYAAAASQYQKHADLAVSPSLSSKEKKVSRRLRNEAERQLDILRMKADRRGQSDFYTYRYFASEGFLPGYSFPRLPLSAYIPGHGPRRGRSGEYLQRPRFLAISEFGPGTFIYHEGSRYQITGVILAHDAEGPDPDTDGALTDRLKLCGNCGYAHAVADGPGPDVCENCSDDLDGPTELRNLLRMRNVSTRHRSRITSDEEKRRRKGYELVSGIRFASRDGRSVIKATVNSETGDPLLRLAYGDTATIWRINLGWQRRKKRAERGFILDLDEGKWISKNREADTSNAVSATRRRVIPYVADARNALLVEPADDLDDKTMASLSAALKAAVQVVFQLEPSELEAEPLPTRDKRRLLLFYESAEGGAGALRQLIRDPDGWQQVADEGLRLCHRNPDPATGSYADDPDNACDAACYSCLLTYQNQWDHELLNRDLAVPILERLTTATLDAASNAEELSGTTSLERKFIDTLKTGGYRQPDREQVYFEAARTRPDFMYDDDYVAIYVDGPHHDYPDRAERDSDRETAMRDLGYRTIRFGYRDDWARIIAEHPDVFGVGQRQPAL